MTENWVDILDTDGKLQVSDQGRVRSKLRGEWRILKTQANRKGYQWLTYTFKREKRRECIHRLVARTFIPKIAGKTHVNHVNGDKNDNSAVNLEWCTNKENAHHAIETGLWQTFLDGQKRVNDLKKRPVWAIRVKSGLVVRLNSVCDAQMACHTKHVCAVIHGKRTKANGYRFEYAG